MMTDEIYRGQDAYYGETLGVVTRKDQKNGECRNLWWKPKEGGGDTEFMFSLRRDGEWRMFPGPANGPGLELLEREMIYLETCVNGHVRTVENTATKNGTTRGGKPTQWRICLDCREAKNIRRRVLTTV